MGLVLSGDVLVLELCLVEEGEAELYLVVVGPVELKEGDLWIDVVLLEQSNHVQFVVGELLVLGFVYVVPVEMGCGVGVEELDEKA